MNGSLTQRTTARARVSLAAVLLCVVPAFRALSDATLANGGVKNIEEYRRFAFAQEGDPARGAQLFGDNQRLACALCHSIDGKASKAGPDLFAIGDKYGRGDLIKAVLSPSDSIAVGYGATYLETRAGEQHLGVIKQATDAWIELMGADGKPVRIATRDIKERRENNISLMPEGLTATLSPQEFTDLIEYLVSLKEPANALMFPA